MKMVSKAFRGARIAVLAAVCACAPVNETYYLPTDERSVHETNSCGYPSGDYFKSLGNGVRFSVHGAPGDGDLWLGFQFVVDDGHSLRFQSNVLEIVEANGTRHHVRLDSESGGRYPSFDPTIPISGPSPVLKIANVRIKGISPNSFRLILPALEVDEIEMYADAIDFFRVEKPGLAYCIQ